MNSEELITTHRVLASIRDVVEEEVGELESESLDEYDELGVRPLHVQKNKSEHKEAIFLLAEGLSEGLNEVEGFESQKEEVENIKEELE